MAKGRAGGGRGGRPRRDAAPQRAGGSRKPGGKSTSGQSAASRPQRTPQPSPAPSPTPPPEVTGPFRLGIIPGATPGRWVDTWNERMRHADLELVPLAVTDQRRALVEGEVDAALVRQPLDGETLSVIPLYDEQAVVVCAKDSHLTAGDELVFADLEGEVLIVPQDDALGILPAAPSLAAGASSGASGRVGPSIPGTVAPRFDPPADTAEAIATVAAGVGIVIVPMSIARLHQRKDVDYRLLREGPVSSVALAWPTDRTTPAVEAFVGIVRGRTANSSRG